MARGYAVKHNRYRSADFKLFLQRKVKYHPSIHSTYTVRYTHKERYAISQRYPFSAITNHKALLASHLPQPSHSHLSSCHNIHTTAFSLSSTTTAAYIDRFPNIYICSENWWRTIWVLGASFLSSFGLLLLLLLRPLYTTALCARFNFFSSFGFLASRSLFVSRK